MSTDRGNDTSQVPERSLFWTLTLTTGALALIAALFLYYVNSISGNWQYLSLSAVGFVIVVAHLVGWSLVISGGNIRLSIWLIVALHILGVITSAIFLDGFWLVGPFLLLLVPFEIGLIDDLRHVPLAFVLSLFGAAGMILVDLWAPFPRVRLLADVPDATQLVSLLLLLQFITHLWVLWYFRLRLSPFHKLRFDLATQLALVFTGLSGFALLLVTIVLMVQIRNTQISQVGQNFRTLAQVNAERVGNTLNDSIDSLLALSRQNAILQAGLSRANADHDQLGSLSIPLLLRNAQKWRSTPDTSEFVLSFRNNPLSIELSKFRGVDLLHGNMLLIDRLGGLVAAQGDRPELFFYGKEDWFQQAWNDGLGGIYIGDLKFDSKQESATVFIAVGALNPRTNQTVGVLASTYSLSGIQREIYSAQLRQDAGIALITPTGVAIAVPDEMMTGLPVWSRVFAAGVLPHSEGGQPFSDSDWSLGNDLDGLAAVIAYSPLFTTSGLKVDDLQSLNWLTIVYQTQIQALAGVTRSIKVAVLVGLLLMILIVLAAAWLAQILTRPIKTLTMAAVAASHGDLDQHAEPVGPVELVALAEAFNALAAHLQFMINNLQEQVAARTMELEVKADELATLNRITSTVASARDMKAALNIVAYEMVYLFAVKQTAIALMDGKRTRLTIIAEYNRDLDAPGTLDLTFPIKESAASQQVIAEGRTLVISQAQINPDGDPVLTLLQITGTHSLMIVPLLARGEVIGTIVITCDYHDRDFTPVEVELAESIAGQIAGAIDNARLFGEMQSAKESAEAANAAKSDFLANVSHELRTPLTSVMGFARIVQKRLREKIFPLLEDVDDRTGKAIQQVDENLEIIVSEGERLTTLINNVLDLSKIEAGKINWSDRLINIPDVIERAVAAAAGLLEDKKELDLSVEIVGDIPDVRGDPDRLIQVVLNLLSNAIKFTETGTIACRIKVVDNEIQVSVSDTGSGIAPEDQARVFEKFTQLGDTLTEKPHGTGLGLPITKEIVESQGGRIWLESEEGKGSTFFFTLPLTVDNTVHTPPAATILEESL